MGIPYQTAIFNIIIMAIWDQPRYLILICQYHKNYFRLKFLQISESIAKKNFTFIIQRHGWKLNTKKSEKFNISKAKVGKTTK